MIRIDALWLCAQPQDMRAGVERLLAVVVNTLGQARAHHGYLFANTRATRVRFTNGERRAHTFGRADAHRTAWSLTTGAAVRIELQWESDDLVPSDVQGHAIAPLTRWW